MIAGGFRPSGAKGPYVGRQGSGPVPTISCSIVGGDPASYIYDTFDYVMGIWGMDNGSGAELSSGELIATGAIATVAVPLKLASRAPTGAEQVTYVAEIRYLRNDAYTYGGGIYFGNPARFFGIQYYLTGFITQLVVGGAYGGGTFYAQSAPDADLATATHTLKVVVKASSVDYYLDGTLYYTENNAINITDPSYPNGLVVSQVGSGTDQFVRIKSFALFGFDLPVVC